MIADLYVTINHHYHFREFYQYHIFIIITILWEISTVLFIFFIHCQYHYIYTTRCFRQKVFVIVFSHNKTNFKAQLISIPCRRWSAYSLAGIILKHVHCYVWQPQGLPRFYRISNRQIQGWSSYGTTSLYRRERIQRGGRLYRDNGVPPLLLPGNGRIPRMHGARRSDDDGRYRDGAPGSSVPVTEFILWTIRRSYARREHSRHGWHKR